MLVDTHCHIQFEGFDPDREAVIQRALEAGVEKMVVIGCDPESSRAPIELAAQYPGVVYATVGLHPHGASMYNPSLLAELRDLAASPQVVAIGECGLDYVKHGAAHEVQWPAFVGQQKLAVELGLPLIVHCREAHMATLAALEEGGGLATRVVMHCFTTHPEWLSQVIAHDCYLGTDGPVTYPKADDARQIAAGAPAERLLLETDCPFLAPQTHRGRRCEPAHVAEIAAKVAEVRETTVDELVRQTGANAARFFGWKA